MNSLFVIAPYKHDDVWVFDDAAVGLTREPFVSGADDMLDLLTASVPNAISGFNLVFSHQPFPGYQVHLTWAREEYGGNWYLWPEKKKEGWLCPALFKYFDAAPRDIYVQAKEKK